MLLHGRLGENKPACFSQLRTGSKIAKASRIFLGVRVDVAAAKHTHTTPHWAGENPMRRGASTHGE